jgi:hypothetical protein
VKQLLTDLDDLQWRDPVGAAIRYERHDIGDGVLGRMGGGKVVDGVRIHSTIEDVGLREEIETLLFGIRPRLRP